MTTSEALKRFRKDFNLKQGEVAKKIGMLQQGYYKYESGRVSLPVDVLIKIADNFDVSTDYLLGRTDNPRPAQIDDEEIKKALALKNAFKSIMSEN